MKIFNNTYQKICAAAYAAIVIFWIILQFMGTKDATSNYVYSFVFGLVPLIGGAIGVVKSKLWGRFKSAIGKSIFHISLGLLLWGIGETIWSYYNIVKHVSAPYPSIADIGFGLSIVFWAIGAVYLSKACGAKFAFFKSTPAKIFTFVVPPLILAGSYYLLVTVARQGTLVPEGETTLKVILDIAYPFGDFISLTLATVILGLSLKYFGGLYRLSIVAILVGLAMMYFGDMVFSYTTTIETYYNGDWGDLLLATGTALMTFGVLGFSSLPVPTSSKKSTTTEA